ncbi:MAG TPA: hypothetical protein P5314_16290, partial [Tetrasphaera sp.]|nr:hypothetical protein [Tetrasphaera sp.]
PNGPGASGVFTLSSAIGTVRPARSQITDLAEVVAGRVRPPGTGRRVYCSVGLAGTEVHLLGRLAEKVSRASGH